MKILIISHAYAERDNHRKLEALAVQHGTQIGVIFPKRWKTWHGEIKVQGTDGKIQRTYEEFTLETLFSGNAGKYFYNPIEIWRVIRSFKPDLVHLEEEPFTPVAFEVALVCLLTKTKLIFFTWENLDLFLGFIRTLIEKIVFSISKKALVGSSGAKERLVRRGYRKDVQILPQFGVDIDAFSYQPKINATEGFVIGFVGRPSFAKGIDVLFKALASLDSFRLLIVTSSGSIPDDIRSLGRQTGVSGRVEYAASIPHYRLPEYFSKMDVFVLPSRTTETWKEQFGRTLIEAMACGVPVLGSSSGAIPEVIGDAGRVFKEGDIRDLAEKIEAFRDQKERLKHSKIGRERVVARFSFEKIAEETFNFYRSVLS